MKKNKFYVLISLITIILLFSISALCNQCGIITPDTTTTVSDTVTEKTNIEKGKESASEETAKQSEQTGTTEKSPESDKKNRNPVISDITISSSTIETNKTYDVTAKATDPDDDKLTGKWTTSGGAINDDSTNPTTWTAPSAGGTYIITLKVTDGKGGEATESKSFDVIPSVTAMNVSKIAAEGGHMEAGGAVNAGDALYVGDSLANKPCFGFISFDITSLAGAIIQSASAVFSLSDHHGDPSFFAALALNDYYWGDRIIKPGDATLAGTVLETFLLSDSTFSCSNAELKKSLQNAIDAKRPRFQLKIYFIGLASDVDSQLDGWVYQQNDVKLSITYIQDS